MNLISSLSILGFASEPVSVIRIYQDSKVMEITGEQKHPSKKYLKRCTKEERKQCFDFHMVSQFICIFVQLSMYTQ